VGVAAGKGKGQLLYKGEVVGQVPEDQIVERLVELAHEVADQIRAERGPGTPTVLA